MSKFTKEESAKLQKILNTELGIWTQIRELTQNQTKLLEVDNIDALEASIDERQTLIEQINGLHQESDLLMQSYISLCEKDVGGKIPAIESLVAKLRELIVGCSQLNDKNLSSARTSSKALIEKVKDLGEKRKGIVAYAPGVPNKSDLFDKKM